MAQSNDLPFDLSLLEGELQQEEAPDPLDLIDDCDQSEVVPEELLQEALRQLQGSQEEQLQGLKVFCEQRDPRSQPLLRPLLRSRSEHSMRAHSVRLSTVTLENFRQASL